ncbi:putative tape measure protein [Vibrio phage VPMCC14]|nr:putative tape measure protein [Vibrio phage VPMCC14]
MARKLAKFVNTVSWRTDLPSWRKLKKDSERLGKELGEIPTKSMMRASRKQEQELLASRTKLADKLRKEDEKARERAKRQSAKDSKSGFESAISGLTQTSGMKASQTLFAEKMRQEDALAKKQQAGMDSHIKAFRKRNAQQEKFLNLQDRVIRRFVLSNREIREMSEAERKVYINQLKQQKTAQGLLHTERRIKAEIADRLHNEKKLTREKQKQTIAQRRLTSSTEQMVGALASVYTVAAAGGAVVRVGMEFQSIEKSFLVVSGSAEKAAENMAFARSEAMRLGGPIIDLSQSYARMLAAAGDKMAIDDLKTLFTGVNESAVALGLNQDKISRIMLAIQQMMSKNKIMAEELTGQLGESLPFALRAMTTAAAKAGLIDGTLSQQKQEAALRKLMENGKLIASEVLPNFGKELQRLANDGNALQRALDENLGPALGRANNTLQEMMVSTFSGLSPALKTILDSFTEVGQESKGLAKIIGSTLGATLLGLTFPIAMTVGGLIDLINLLKEMTGTSDETFNEILKWTFGILGLAAGVFTLVKAIRMLTKGFKTLTGLGKGVSETIEKVSKATGQAGKYTGDWGSVQKTASGTGGLSGILSKIAGPLAALTGVMELGDRLSSTQERNKFITDRVLSGKSLFERDKNPNKVEVLVGVDPRSGTIEPFVMNKINELDEQKMIDFYNNISPSD